MKCPGQDTRYWKPGAIFETRCSNCGGALEFFKDESTRRCKNCGQKVVNPKMDFGCAAYCKFAEQCLGEIPPELFAKRDDLLKDRLAIEIKRYFARDLRRITHATRVARYAEEIVKEEKGDLAVALSAAYLHDIGIKEAEAKHQSTDSEYQYLEGPPVAREILIRLGAREDLIEEVCDIISHHHHPRSEESVNFKAVYDADRIVNLKEKQEETSMEAEGLAEVIEKSFLTRSGREIALRALLDSDTASPSRQPVDPY